MQNEIIKTALQHPEIIQDVLQSGFVSGRELQKLQRVYDGYLKNKKMPSYEILKGIFKFYKDDENETDSGLVYQILHEFNVERYIEEVQNLLYQSSSELSIEKIHEVGKRYLKSYKDKAGDRFQLRSFEDVIQLKAEMDEKEEEFLETGFQSINRLTRGLNHELPGGWRPGSLYSIMGLSGYGKSIFLTNFARDSWSRNNNVLYITTEMNHLQTYERILKSYYGVGDFDEIALYRNKPFPTGIIEVVKVHPNDTTTLNIQSIIDQLEWKPDILFIDYADELKSHEMSNNDYEGQGVVYAGLKILAEDNNFPVITATQTNREAENKDKGGTKGWVGMGSIADSTKKIRLVDMLFSITQSPEEKEKNHINLLVLKNRFGNSNVKISFNIDYEKMLLSEVKSVDVFVTGQNIEDMTHEPKNEDSPFPISIKLNRRGKI